MSKWRAIFTQIQPNREELRKVSKESGIYPDSIQELNDSLLFLVKDGSERRLVVLGSLQNEFTGEVETFGSIQAKVAPLTWENGQVLRRLFPWTAPVAFGLAGASMGFGDRLGAASPGHIAAIKGRGIRPVLAQQSTRELNLTNRDYRQVLDAASWAVFQEGFTEGFGADGDHLKRAEDVQMALDLGFSMITLDCSEHIDNTIPALSDAEVSTRYSELPPELRSLMEKEYLERTFQLQSGRKITFTGAGLQRIVLIYYRALDFAQTIYQELIRTAGRPIDFEISIDEVTTPTAPGDHFLVAAELKRREVQANSIAPRFIGEFQKGIDYIGDRDQFAREFAIHAEIADEFGYKISVHSGSDKFSIFGLIGQLTNGRYHVKTAGTNWLEAVRVIAMVDPNLYREMHAYALTNLAEARKYYHVTMDLQKIPRLADLSNAELPVLMEENNARQLLHICYGLILQARDAEGNLLLRPRIYETLDKYTQLYCERLQTHIGRHIDCLQAK